MAALTTQVVPYAGGLANRTYAAATAGGDDCECPSYGGQILLEVKNTSGTSCTVTLAGSGTNQYGSANPSPAYVVAITTGTNLIPLHPSLNNGSGRISIAYSVSASITVGVFKVSYNA